MFDLVQVGENTYYVDFPSKIGVYKPNGSNDVYLIDSGNDKAIARRVLKMLETRGWQLKAIFNTHCHADHVGGNKFLQDATGCKIYVPDIDCGAVTNAALNPVMLYGAYPTKELTHKFYLAESSAALPLSGAEMPQGLEWYPLIGHTMGMVGYKTADNVYFVADSVVSPDVLKKYTVTYLISVGDYLKTLDYLDGLNTGVFIPSHCDKTEDIKNYTGPCRQYVEKIIGEVLEFCKTPRLTDDVIKHFFDNNELDFNMMQYALIGSTIRSYLSYLQGLKQIEIVCADNRIYWKTL